MWKYNKCAKVLEYVSVLAFRSSIKVHLCACGICIISGVSSSKDSTDLKPLAGWTPKEEEQEGGLQGFV